MKDLAILAAREAGKLMLDWRNKFPPGPALMEYKSAKDVVTEVDTRAEALIISHIKQNFPEHLILGEEGGFHRPQTGNSSITWIIDPIDGTANYVADLATSCVSIGIAEGDQIIIGVVYNPFRDELFVAEKGKGAFLNQFRISVGVEQDLNKSLVCFDLGYNEAVAVEQLKQAVYFRPRVRTMRILGSAVLALCNVACGRFDLFYHRSLSPWDLAAGMLLIEEAGGKITDENNNPTTYLRPGIVAANPAIHRQFFEAKNEYKPE